MFGRLPWFALERRMRAFFFLVFFDMGSHPRVYEVPGTRHDGGRRDRRRTATDTSPARVAAA
jgi:hypothetical protein